MFLFLASLEDVKQAITEAEVELELCLVADCCEEGRENGDQTLWVLLVQSVPQHVMEVGIECLLIHRADALESLSEKINCFLVVNPMLCLVDNSPEDLDPYLEEVLLIVLAVLLRG